MQPRQTWPRPLPLHLTIAMATWLSSVGALPSARLGLLPWQRTLARRAAELSAELSAADPTALMLAVGEAANARVNAMLEGVRRYQEHPYRREAPALRVLWQSGSAQLLDYGAPDQPDGPVALFVPSLVNRGYVLDLMADKSLLRFLAAGGIRPLLMEWGAPGEAERGYDVGGYVAGPLSAALEVACDAAGGPVLLAGYCMGGNLALALALREPARIARLALLATPWDFEAGEGAGTPLLRDIGPWLETVLGAFGELPIDVLQTIFAALDPNLAGRKFRAFAELDPASDEARHFVALEDWLNDGVPLTPGVARECLVEWYGENSPGRGQWRVAGELVEPRAVACPSLVVVPRADRIVPPASAAALAELIPDAQRLTPPSGHIGMVAGRRAPEGLWKPLLAWLSAP